MKVEALLIAVNACALGMALLTLCFYMTRVPRFFRRTHPGDLAAGLFLLIAVTDLGKSLITGLGVSLHALPFANGVLNAAIVLYPASLWIYIRTLTDPKPSFSVADLWHLSPAYLIFVSGTPAVAPDFQMLAEAAVWLGTILFYSLKSMARLSRHRKHVRHISSADETVSLNWLSQFIVFLLACGALVFIDKILASVSEQAFLNGLALGVFNLMLIGGFCFFSLIQGPAAPSWSGAVAVRPQTDTKQASYARSPLSKSDCDRILMKLDRIMEQKALWREPSLHLKDLSDKTGVSLNNISQALNTHRQINFYDYVNGWRIQDACGLLKTSNKPVLEIAMDVGFNSKSTFNSAFKRITGLTPSAYKTTDKCIPETDDLVRTGLSGREIKSPAPSNGPIQAALPDIFEPTAKWLHARWIEMKRRVEPWFDTASPVTHVSGCTMRNTRLALGAAALLAALAYLPIASHSVKAFSSDLDVATVDPSTLLIAFGFTDAIALRDGDARLSLKFTPQGSSNPAVDETHGLILIPNETVKNAPQPEDGETIFIVTVAPDDIPTLKKAQKELLSFREKGITGDGSFSFGVFGSCSMGAVELTQVPYRVFARAGEQENFTQMVDHADLLTLLADDERAKFLQNLKPCT